MDNSKPDRIKMIIEHYGLNKNSLAIKCGLNSGNVGKMLSGQQKITDKTIEKICKAFPELNLNWIKTGEGQMINAIVGGSSSVTRNTENDFSLVPLINIDSVGGMDSPNILASGDQFVERLIPFTGALEGDRAIYQSGDSMTPTIPAGSVLQIRKVEDWHEYFGYGGIFVLWLKDNRRITKQVMKYSPDPQNYVTCHSFNPDSADEELPKKFIREVWKVIKVLADKGW